MPISRKTRKRVGLIVFGLVALIAAIVAWDYYFETDILGATGRFAMRFFAWLWEFAVETARLLWRILLDVLAYGWRVVLVALERFVAFLPSIGAGRFTKFLWPMAMGAAANRYFTRTRRNGKSGLWQRIKTEFYDTVERLAVWWRAQHFAAKCAIVALMITVQVHLHWWLVFFPIGFLIPYLAMLLNSLQRWVLGPVLEQWYLSRFGTLHARIKARALSWQWVRSIIATYRLFKLYFETGWRIWYYDARFAFPAWRPFWRETTGRVWFALVTLTNGEWAKRRMHKHPLLGGGVAHRVRSRAYAPISQDNEAAG
jgi:hypothetical protein